MAQYHCNYCQEDIIGLRVKCAECADFDLCLQCFSCGAEIGCHKNIHGYQIIDCGNFPIFEPPQNWKAQEELKLLDAIEQYGFGNWGDIAKEVDTRDADEVKEHYNNMYIFGNIGRASWPQNVLLKPRDHTCPEGGPLSPSLTTRLPGLELTAQEQQELGYMPERDDFEREYDNEAETLVSNLSINPEDEDIDIALKLCHVDMYSRRLRERLRRKKIARDYNLVAQFYSSANNKSTKSQNSKKKHSKEEREFQERMRSMAQFHTLQEQEQLFENMQKEKELKARIKELVRYRRNGLTKLEEAAEFETARYKREKRKENKKKSGAVNGNQHHRKSSTASKRQEERGKEDTIQEQLGNAGGGDEEKKEESDVDVTLLAGSELLSVKEKKLCKALGLRPAIYTTLKAVLLKDHLLRRQGIPVKQCHPYGVDKLRRRRIISFMINSGWITTP